LKPTSKSYKSHYTNNWAFARALTSDQKIDKRVQRNKFPRIHSNVYQRAFRCIPGELFFWTLWSTFRCIPDKKIKQGYVVYVFLWVPLIWGVKVLYNHIASYSIKHYVIKCSYMVNYNYNTHEYMLITYHTATKLFQQR